eukprot:12932104-Prorocentrum_lima.AAC.1
MMAFSSAHAYTQAANKRVSSEVSTTACSAMRCPRYVIGQDLAVVLFGLQLRVARHIGDAQHGRSKLRDAAIDP